MAEANLKDVLKYIDEREKTLSHYSDKLRDAIQRIANVFGNTSLCQICDREEEDGVHHKYTRRRDGKGYDELPADDPSGIPTVVPSNFKEYLAVDTEKGLVFYELTKNPHSFVPKVFVSINVEDDQPFYVSESEYYEDNYELRLAINRHELVVVRHDKNYPEPITVGFGSLSRGTLKALVKSGRLAPFLEKVAKTLEAKGEEYREVAEMAEKLVKAIE